MADRAPAAAGFAAAVAADLLTQVRAYNREHAATSPAWVEPRVALVTELAILIAARGERDDLLSALAGFDRGRWNPGRNVERVLAGEVLVAPELSTLERADELAAALPNANKLLHRLSVAYMHDVVERANQVRDRAAAELAAAKPDAQFAALERRVAEAEGKAARATAEVARAGASEQQLLRENGLMRAELRLVAEQDNTSDPDAYVAAVVAGFAQQGPREGLLVGEPPEDHADASLPKGIRPRENGRFHAYLTRAETSDGKQRGVGTFDSIEEAVAARDAALAEESQVAAA